MGSVALLAQVVDRIKAPVTPLGVADWRLPLVERRLEAGLRLCTVCFSQYSLYLSCHLVDLAVLSP